MRKKKDSVCINVRIDAVLASRLNEICEMEDRTKTSLVERALRQYFESYDTAEEKDG